MLAMLAKAGESRALIMQAHCTSFTAFNIRKLHQSVYIGSRMQTASTQQARASGKTDPHAVSPAAPEDTTSAASFPFSRPQTDIPPAEYARLRKECPISKAKLFDGTDIWMFSKYKDVCSVLQDNRFSKVRTHPGFPELVPGAKGAIAGREPTFVDMDPPEHTKYRGMVEHFFTKEKAEEMRPVIQGHVKRLLDNLKQKTAPVDLNVEFSLPLAFNVIYEVLGIPAKDHDRIISNIGARTSGSSTARDAAAAQQDLVNYVGDLIKNKAYIHGDNLINDLVEKQLKTGKLSEEQLVAHIFLLLVAGNATVASQINLGVISLMQHHDQWKALCGDPSLVPGAVEEVFRYHTASSYALRRVAKEDVNVSGVTVKSGEGIIALNQSANRDEDVFPDPDTFNIRRDASKELGFGYGTHVCVAQWLSRVELQCALHGLAQTFPNLQLAIPVSQLKYTDPTKDVGVSELPIKW